MSNSLSKEEKTKLAAGLKKTGLVTISVLLIIGLCLPTLALIM